MILYVNAFGFAKTEKFFNEHVYKIDQHRCFTDKRIKDVVESFEVDYLNHELSFGNGDELRRMLTMQMNACR